MIRAIPLFLRPSALALKNRWKRRAAQSMYIRDAVILFCVVLLIKFIHDFASAGFNLFFKFKVVTDPLLPAIFNLCALCIISLIFFSSCGFSLSSLYLAEDLELMLAAPISKRRLYSAKLLQIFFSSTWIIFVCSLPCMFAAASVYNTVPQFFLIAAAAFLPLLVTSCAMAIMFTTMLVRYIPPIVQRAAAPAIILIVCITGLFFLNSGIEISRASSITSVMPLLQSAHSMNAIWLPTSWAGSITASALTGTDLQFLPKLIALYTCSIVSCYVSRSYVCANYEKALVAVRNNNRSIAIKSKTSHLLIEKLFPFICKQTRAIACKEIKTFSRDLTQIMQLSVLLLLCLIYLLNFRSFFQSESSSFGSLEMRQAISFLLNILLGSLIITSICARFVFSSVSLEGKNLWLVLKSPMPLEKVLRAKFMFWFLPIGCFSIVIMCSGAFALQSPPIMIYATTVCSLIMAYGICGCGIGMGAYFSNFDWDHSAQIVTGVGSIVFMLTSLFMAIINLAVVSAVLICCWLYHNSEHFSEHHFYLTLAALSISFFYINFISASHFIRVGCRALSNKLSLAS